MPELRPDLDGVRLHAVGKPEIWLVFHGRRHRVAGPAVYESLFSESTGLLLNDGLDAIEEGAELNEGTCLVRFDGRSNVYLLTGSGGNTSVHEIPSMETFVDFALNMGRVRDVPALLRHAVREGEALTSAPDRAAGAA